MAETTLSKLAALDKQRAKLIEAAKGEWMQSHSDAVAALKELETTMQANGVDFKSAFGGSTRKSGGGGGGKRGPRKSEEEVTAAIVKAAGSKETFKTSDIEDKVAEILDAARANISADMAKAEKSGHIKYTGKKDGLAKIFKLK